MDHERTARRDIARVKDAATPGKPPLQFLDPQPILLTLWEQNEALKQRVAALEALVVPVR